MRGGPSNSEYRLRVQTADCCLGPMAEVVSEIGKGGINRQVRVGKVNASEPPTTCRKS
jgi:hypothetical protein